VTTGPGRAAPQPRGGGLIAAASWMGVGHLLAQAAAYGSLIVLARMLPPASFGTVAVGTAVVHLVALLVDRGTYGGIIVHPRLSRPLLARAVRRCLLIAVVLGGGMAAAAGPLVGTFARGGDAAAVAALALCLPLHAVAVVPSAVLHKALRFRRIAGMTATANIVSAFVAVGAGLAGAGVWALVARQVVLFGLLAVLSAVLVRPELRRLPGISAGAADRGQVGDRWFFLFTATLVLATHLDHLVVGSSGDAARVGLYALAFTIAMTPVSHVSEQVGKVLFAAAATDPAGGGRRTAPSVWFMALLLLPLVPVGILVAPAVLPALLGPEWTGLVAAFQILWVAGVVHAVVNCIGEPLSGMGHMRFRATVMVVRCVVTLPLLWVLVQADGIRGAAVAQLLVSLGYAAVYATAGARRAGTSPADLWRGLRPVLAATGFQVLVTAAALVALRVAGMPDVRAGCVAAAVGLASAVPLLHACVARLRAA
jgi:O-antigen/teichoic acid export membrane protein